jgi:hypothetical protein
VLNPIHKAVHPPVQKPIYTHWESTKSLYLGLLVRLVFIIVAIYVVWYWITPEKERIALKYMISKDAVVVEPKPHGCAFDDAPLGDKHCHYERIVDVQRECPQAGCRATGVYVHWERVEE